MRAFETIQIPQKLERTVMFFPRCNRWTVAALALTAMAIPGSVSAQTPVRPDATAMPAAQFPARNDLKSLTTSGSYLATQRSEEQRAA
jgi:hypothetical protein